MIQAILFDFNGVVIDDERIQMKAYQDVFAEKDIELTEDDYFANLGLSDAVFAETIFRNAGRDAKPDEIAETTAAKTVKWKESIDRNVPIFDGVEDFLKRMNGGFTVGLVSMATREEIDHVLSKTGLAECFEVIVSAEDVPTTKPDPACYREGFRRIDLACVAKGNSPITRRQCVVIEDSPAGIQSAKSARLKALGVTNTVGEDDLRKAGADAVTSNLSDWNAESIRRVF